VGVGGIGVDVATGASATDVAAGAVSCGLHPTKRRVTIARPIAACNTFRMFIVLTPFSAQGNYA
jgi:hypothetical protein